MDAVQAPIVPVIGGLIRQVPGTISLGQGVVHYGPPPAALDAVRGALDRRRPRTNTRTAPACRRWSSGWRAKLRAENGIDVDARQPRHGHRRREHGVHARGAGDHRAGRRDHPERPVLLQPRDGDPDGRLHGGPRRHRRSLSAAARRAARGDHRSHPRDRHRVAEQPERRRLQRGRAARRSTRSAASAASITSPTRSTSTSPTDRRRHVSSGSFPGAEEHTIAMYSLSKAYGFAGWRDRLHDVSGAPGGGDGEEPGHDPGLPAGGVAGGGDRGARRRPRLLRAARPRARRRSATSSSRQLSALAPLAERAGGRRRVLLPAEGGDRRRIR